MHDSVLSRVQRKKMGELWFTNHGDLEVRNHTHTIDFFGKNISVPKECCAPKFLHALYNDECLLAHISPGTGVPPTFLYGSKIGLKFGVSAPVTLKEESAT